MVFVTKLALVVLPALAGFSVLAQVSSQGTGTNPGGKASANRLNAKVPLGTVQAWNVDVTGTLDVGKIAKEQGGNVNIIQIIPPSISRGNSQNQEISATLTLDGKIAKIMKAEDGTDVLVITATPNSGKAYLRLTGTIFNRNMTDINNGSVDITPEEKARFTGDYYAFNVKSDAVKAQLNNLGLLRNQGESDSNFVKRICLWFSKNKDYESSAHGANSEAIFKMGALNCNGASKTLVAILRANGVAAKANPRLFLIRDAKTDQHSDVLACFADQKKWVGIAGSGLVSRKAAIASAGLYNSPAFGRDIDPGFNGIFIDMADDVGHMVVIPGVSRYYSFYNEQNPTWSKVGTDGEVRGKVYFDYTHKFTPVSIDPN